VEATGRPGSSPRGLLARQREIAEQVRELARRDAESQSGLQAQAEGLAGELGALRDEMGRQGLSGSQGHAQNAASLMEHQAAPAMGRSVEEMGAGRVSSARDQQRQAADHAENAARQAADLAAALRREAEAAAQAAGGVMAEAPSGQPGQPSDAEGQGRGEAQGKPQSGVASARQAQARASRDLEAGRAEGAGPEGRASSSTSAAQAMRDAAERLRASAAGASGERMRRQLASGRRPGRPGDASDRTPKSGPGRAVAVSTETLAAADAAASRRRWGDLPGELRNEILQMSRSPYREEYARLIQLYFREIGAAAATGDGGAQP
jgi:hypothetical protein